MKRLTLLLVVGSCTPESPPPTCPTCPPEGAPKTPEGETAKAPEIPPTAPGQYTNHIGDPKAGYWDKDGKWQWHNEESKEANSTLSYLAAAGVGAAGGAALAYLFTKKNFEQNNPQGWQPQTVTSSNYVDKRGNPISEEEYNRRKAQSEGDKRRNAQMKAPTRPAPTRAMQPYQSQPRTPPKKPLGINRWNRKRRR